MAPRQLRSPGLVLEISHRGCVPRAPGLACRGPLESVLSPAIATAFVTLGKGPENLRTESYTPPSFEGGEDVPLWRKQLYTTSPCTGEA